MPLYEYQCDACGNRFEKIVQFSDPPLEICPACGGKVQKLFSSPAIQFKGSGFYITDYAKKPASDGSGKSSSEKASEKSGDSSKSDSTKSDSSKSASTTSDSSKGDTSKGDTSTSTAGSTSKD
jgi:putative FmdB family regulatory protein